MTIQEHVDSVHEKLCIQIELERRSGINLLVDWKAKADQASAQLRDFLSKEDYEEPMLCDYLSCEDEAAKNCEGHCEYHYYEYVEEMKADNDMDLEDDDDEREWLDDDDDEWDDDDDDDDDDIEWDDDE